MEWQPIATAPFDEPVLISWVNSHGNRVVATAWMNLKDVEMYNERAEGYKVKARKAVWSFDYEGVFHVKHLRDPNEVRPLRGTHPPEEQ